MLNISRKLTNHRSQLIELTQLGIHYAYSISGFLIVALCPRSWLEPFLTFFPLFNLIFSLLTALFYTNFRSRILDGLLILVSVSAIAVYVIHGHPAFLIGTFALTVIISDFSISQSFSSRWSSAIRLFLISATIVSIFKFEAFLYSRTCIAILLMFIAIFLKQYRHSKIELPAFSKFKKVITINLLYFGPLIFIGIFDNNYMKYGYLLYAVVSNILIRFIDFEIKSRISGNTVSISWVYNFFSLLSLLAIVAFSAFFSLYFILLTFPFVGLYFMRSGYLNEKWI